MAIIDIEGLLKKLRNTLPGNLTPAEDNSMSPGGQSVTTPEGRGMSLPAPVDAQPNTMYSSSGVPKPVATPAPEDDSQHIRPSLGGIFGKWGSLSEQEKGDVLVNLGVGLMANSQGNSFATALGKSAQGYQEGRAGEVSAALAQKNKNREFGQKDTDNANTLELKKATLGLQETPAEKRRRAAMDDARQAATKKDMLGNASVDIPLMNRLLRGMGEQPIDIGPDSGLPAPVGYQSPASSGAMTPPVASAPPIQAPAAPARPTIPPGAIDMLKKNPGSAKLFDQKYGIGSAKQYLGM